MTRKRRTARLPVKLAAGVASLAIAMLLAESALALLWPQRTWNRLLAGQAKHFCLLSVFEPCVYLPFRLRPGAVDRIETVDFEHEWRINSHGFREPERPLEKQPGEFRVLALGDSFTAGHGVEARDAWPRVLERQLGGPARNVRVINAGYAAGYAPDCYYAYLSRNLERLEADLVVVGLFAGNDSYEMINHFDAEVDEHGLPVRVMSRECWVDDGGRRRRTKAALPIAYQYPVLRNSHLWMLAMQCSSDSVRPSTAFHTPHRRRYIPTMEAAYRRSVRMLTGIVRLTREEGIGLLVAIIPDCVQIDPTIEHWATSDPEFDADMPQARWLTDLHDAGIDVLDLRPAIVDRYRENGRDLWALYYRNDRHFTRLGQRVTAEAIREAVARTPAWRRGMKSFP